MDGHQLQLRNLDKVLYPADGTTKAHVLDYYARVAPVLLPLLADRPVTRFRWPDGIDGHWFVEKQVPAGTPAWVRTVTVDTPGSSQARDRATFPFVDDVATLTWLSNAAALELHVPQWTIDQRSGDHHGPHRPDRVVIDLDPGPPAGLAECAQVALVVRERLARDGLDCLPVTSGSKGMQLYATVSGHQHSDVIRHYARRIAEELEHQERLVVSSMRKTSRTGRVLLDWSQNHHYKTTISPYSLRGRRLPWVATPRTWSEIQDVRALTQVHYSEVPDRIQRLGDLTEPLRQTGPAIPDS
ncbi:MAG: non-homologous end-joining DNA ligase [Angustibacter sp.]